MTPYDKALANAAFEERLLEEVRGVFGELWETLPDMFRPVILADLKYLWTKEGGYRGFGTVNALVLEYQELLVRRA